MNTLKSTPVTAERRSDALAVRRTVTAEIKRSNLSREQIADRMTELVGIPITARMLLAFTAESKELHRFPAEFDLAFCEAVGSFKLIRERVKRAGLRLIGPEEERLIAIGKAFEQKRKAEIALERVGK